MNDMRRVEKVYTYITQGKRLLVFRHVDFPAAGIQIPGGTIEYGESPEAAALREAGEETGLQDLVVNGYLGRDEFLDTSMTPHRILTAVRKAFCRHVFEYWTGDQFWSIWRCKKCGRVRSERL